MTESAKNKILKLAWLLSEVEHVLSQLSEDDAMGQTGKPLVGEIDGDVYLVQRKVANLLSRAEGG